MEFQEAACVLHSGGLPPTPAYLQQPAQPVCGVSFDPVEERLWLTDSDGFLASYALPDVAPYCSVRTCWASTYDDAEWGITSLPRSAIRPVVMAR